MYNKPTDNSQDDIASENGTAAEETVKISQNPENEPASAGSEKNAENQTTPLNIINEDASLGGEEHSLYSRSFSGDSALLNFFTRSYEQIYLEESFYGLLLRYGLLIIAIMLSWGITGFISDVSARCTFSFFIIFIFGAVPRFFYIRYYRVYRNNEIKNDYSPHSFTDRLIYSTRKNLSSLFMFLLSGAILFYILVAHTKNGGLIFLQSFILFALLNTVFNVPGCSRLMKADSKISFFRFNRRFAVALICGLAGFASGYFLYEPSISLKEANDIIFGSFNADYHNNLFVILIQGLNYTVALIDLTLYSLTNATWYGLMKALLIGMPMAVFSAHVAMMLGMLTMPWDEFKMINSKQEWVKQRKCFLVRNWKTIMLPLFMTVFMVALYVFGYPRYQQYLEMARLSAAGQVKIEAELIGGVKYKLGTLKEIQSIKNNGLKELHQLMTTASTEIDKHFEELNDSAEQFVTWYKARNKQYPFTAGETQLKQSFISTLKIRNLDNSLNNMRKDIAKFAEEILVSTRDSIDRVLEDNKLQNEEGVKQLKLGQNIDPELLYELDTGTGKNIYLKGDLRQQINMPSTESVLIKDFDDPDSEWFNNASSKSMQNIEDQLFGTKTENDGNNVQDQDEEGEGAIEDRLLKHLLSMLYACRATITESMAASLNMPLENGNKSVKKGRPVNNAIIDAESVTADEKDPEPED